jgi:hypothetical protein
MRRKPEFCGATTNSARLQTYDRLIAAALANSFVPHGTAALPKRRKRKLENEKTRKAKTPLV